MFQMLSRIYSMTNKSFNSDDLNKMDKRYRAAFINSLSGFKSANLIGTKDHLGQTNLAIFSSAFHLGADPALIGLISRPNTTPRHSLENIKETNFYTLNHVTKEMYEKAHQTSARYPKERSEFKEVGLTEEYQDNFFSPYVKEAKIKLGIELCEIIKIERNQTELIIGEIKFLYLPENIINQNGYVDIEKAETICLSGLDHYHQTKVIRQMPYAKPTP